MIATKIRMLAAIMFTDIVGYTALMQENENKAKSLRNKQKDILEEKIFDHKGQILQYYGDGTLSIFGSVIEAALCAVEIQNDLQKEPVVPLRIGIHVGDVVYDDDGVYGDAVNVASRIENLSAAGAVLISEKVYDELRNQENLEAVPLGRFELKNVKKPVEIYALSSPGLFIPSLEETQKKAGSSDNSVAVLPFVNMSADPENEYFSDGITEEILNALSHVEGLLVTSRTSSFAFKGKNEDIRQIGNQLGVSTVLEGSVRKIGNRVRITAQLINTKDGYHRWSEIYDRSLEDIFAVQDEISRTIAQQLSQRLSYSDTKEPLVKPKTYNLEAYNLFLKGRYYWNKWTPEDFKKAIECNEESLKIDPDFVYAYVGLGSTHLILGSFGYVEPKPALEKAKSYAEKALSLDDSISESHFCYALVQLFYEWDWEKANTSFQKALKINPGSADVHYTYALYLLAMSRLREALAEVEKAHTLDPLSLPINMQLGSTYYYSRRFDDAIEQYKNTLELDENFRSAMYGMGWTYLAMGETQKAIEVILKAQKQAGSELKGVSALGYAYAKAGNREKAEECIQKLLRRKELDMQVSLNMDLAIVYAGLNNLDQLFHHLELAYQDRSGGMIFLNIHPEWASFKSDPRFTELIKKIGLA